MSNITLDAATSIVDAAVAYAAQIGVPSTVTVLDTGARLVASKRMDGAPLVSVDSSFAKARTAVFFKAPTEALVGAIQPGAPLYTLGDATSEQLTFLAGGVPIFVGDELVGAIGSGGGTPEQDQEIALAAVSTFSRAS
jgi:uncharacterized protein GlcG (DUF336 family)